MDNFDRGVADTWLSNLLSEYEISLNKIDLLDRESVLSQEKNFDAIFHLAAIVGVKHVLKRPYAVMVDNIRMLDNVLALARTQSSYQWHGSSQVGFEKYTYESNENNSSIIHYKMVRGGHWWDYSLDDNLKTSRLLWDFFKNHTKSD